MTFFGIESYYVIISLPFIFVMLRLVLSNKLVPYFKKRELKAQLRQDPHWPTIEKKTQCLEALYKTVHAKSASIRYRLIHLIQNKEFIYGEIDFLSFYTILNRASPSAKDVFYDLGAGSGKSVISTMIYFNVKKAIGIELLPPLYKQSKHQLEQAIQQCEGDNLKKEYLARMKHVHFINASFLNEDFKHADIIYVAATCLTDETWQALIDKMAQLKPGSRIIVATRNIQHEQFESIYEGIELMSWGLCPLKIYRIKS